MQFIINVTTQASMMIILINLYEQLLILVLYSSSGILIFKTTK